MPRNVTIDLVTDDPATEEFVLYLVEDGPWPDDEAAWRTMLAEVQSRILAAVDVAIDGHLAKKYPDSAERSIRIQVDSPSGCPARLEALVKAVGRFLRDDPSYSEAIKSSRHVQALRLVTGHQIGRFGSIH